MGNQIPEIMSLNPAELIAWCKQRKNSQGISNMKLSEMSGVPVGTIDRILAGKYTEFRYSSIQPIVAVLVGYGEATPVPDEKDEQQAQYYYDTIEGYKMIVDNKNHEIEELTLMMNRYLDEIHFLKEHIKWMENVVNDLKDMKK